MVARRAPLIVDAAGQAEFEEDITLSNPFWATTDEQEGDTPPRPNDQSLLDV